MSHLLAPGMVPASVHAAGAPHGGRSLTLVAAFVRTRA